MQINYCYNITLHLIGAQYKIMQKRPYAFREALA